MSHLLDLCFLKLQLSDKILLSKKNQRNKQIIEDNNRKLSSGKEKIINYIVLNITYNRAQLHRNLLRSSTTPKTTAET